MTTWNPKYKTLDHWRGIAALWVMLHHGFVSTYDRSLYPLIEPIKFIAAYGYLGVHIFFVISGYCIAASAYKLILKNSSPIDFIKNRFLRLFPVYWLAFLFTISIHLISSPFNKTDIWHNLPDSWQSWIGNIFLIQPYLNTSEYVIVYWTLVVEVAFYLLATVLLIINNTINLKIALFIGLMLGIASPFIYIDKITFLSYWSEFFCGILLFLALFIKSNKKNNSLFLLLIAVLGLIDILLKFLFSISNPSHQQLGIAAGFSLLLYYFYKSDSKINSIYQIKWLKTVGIFSYSLYLLHVPLVGKVLNLGLKITSVESPIYLLLQIGAWGVAISIGYIFYRLIEQPLNNWRYRYIRDSTKNNLLIKQIAVNQKI